ncbi:MAG: hypothetical protein JNK38_22805 [Acidobacteria bacterium]|nr:hypothetical protein [Acidobacteriota bacterium]
MANFKLVSQIRDIETIAVGRAIRELAQLNRRYGKGRWRKLKGIAEVELDDGTIQTAEIHWYEAHSIGKRKMKIKTLFG